jgi:hypothetical protein
MLALMANNRCLFVCLFVCLFYLLAICSMCSSSRGLLCSTSRSSTPARQADLIPNLLIPGGAAVRAYGMCCLHCQDWPVAGDSRL